MKMIDDKMNNKETFQVLQEYGSVWEAFEYGFRSEQMAEVGTRFYDKIKRLQNDWQMFNIEQYSILNTEDFDNE